MLGGRVCSTVSPFLFRTSPFCPVLSLLIMPLSIPQPLAFLRSVAVVVYTSECILLAFSWLYALGSWRSLQCCIIAFVSFFSFKAQHRFYAAMDFLHLYPEPRSWSCCVVRIEKCKRNSASRRSAAPSSQRDLGSQLLASLPRKVTSAVTNRGAAILLAQAPSCRQALTAYVSRPPDWLRRSPGTERSPVPFCCRRGPYMTVNSWCTCGRPTRECYFSASVLSIAQTRIERESKLEHLAIPADPPRLRDVSTQYIGIVLLKHRTANVEL
jgi:hypothetical protein